MPHTTPLTRNGELTDSPSIDISRPPLNRQELREWLNRHLRLEFPPAPIIPGHATPLDYLEHAFLGDTFESGGEAISTPPQALPPDCIVWANRGGGKTFLGALASALDLVFKPGIEIRILAGSLDQAGKMHHHLRRLFEEPPFNSFLKKRITDTSITTKAGSRVEILAQSETSVRGTRVQKLRCDEIELFGDDVWEAAQLTTRAVHLGKWRIRGAIECFSTMHKGHGLMSRLVSESQWGRLSACRGGSPPHPAQASRILFRWGMLDVLELCPPERTCETCALFDECQGRAKPGPQRPLGGHMQIDDAAQQKSRVSRKTWDAEMLCLRPQRSDNVFSEFDRSRHIVQQDPQAGQWVAGMDFGFRAPTVILWGRVDDAGVLTICHEYVVAETVLDAHIRAILAPERPRLSWIAVDVAGESRDFHTGRSSAQLMREAGLITRASAQPIEAGIALIQARLAPADHSPPRLYIHQRCTHLLRAIEEYHYDPAKPESRTPLKDGKHDHAIDALRYLIFALDRPSGLRTVSYVGG